MTALLDAVLSLSVLTIVGLGCLAFGFGVVVGFLHRAYTNQRVPFYASIIVGLGAIGLGINSASALIEIVSNMSAETAEPLVLQNIETNVVSTLVGGVAAWTGGRAGDVLAPNVRAMIGANEVSTEVSKLVRTVGRVISVTVPERIEDIDGYEPVSPETKAKLVGIELVFPRGLTVDELRDRIATRLREDYGVGHVDVEVNDEGDIEYLALGSRTAGIGPTLSPRRVALAVTANPAPSASPGDRVQLWELPEPATEAEADLNETTLEFDHPPSGDGTTPDGEATRESEDGATGTGDERAGPGPGPEPERELETDDLPPRLRAHPDRWYRPNSESYAFAVRTPDGDRRYAKTAAAAVQLLERIYGSDDESAPEPGDETDEATREPKRVATGELRATSGDVATLTVDVSRLDDIDQSTTYRLITLQSNRDSEREFATLLRAANQTMDTASVEAGGPLEGVPIGALKPCIAAVHSPNGDVETLPPNDRRCEANETLYAIGWHDELRKLAAAAKGK